MTVNDGDPKEDTHPLSLLLLSNLFKPVARARVASCVRPQYYDSFVSLTSSPAVGCRPLVIPGYCPMILVNHLGWSFCSEARSTCCIGFVISPLQLKVAVCCGSTSVIWLPDACMAFCSLLHMLLRLVHYAVGTTAGVLKRSCRLSFRGLCVTSPFP